MNWDEVDDACLTSSPRRRRGVTLRQFFSRPVATPIVTNDLALDETQLLASLRERDETAFVTLVRQYHGPLLRLAMVYAGSRAVAEEIVQETWLGVLQGIDRFEGRASFKLVHYVSQRSPTGWSRAVFVECCSRKVRAPLGALPGNAWASPTSVGAMTDSATENNRRRLRASASDHAGRARVKR